MRLLLNLLEHPFTAEIDAPTPQAHSTSVSLTCLSSSPHLLLPSFAISSPFSLLTSHISPLTSFLPFYDPLSPPSRPLRARVSAFFECQTLVCPKDEPGMPTHPIATTPCFISVPQPPRGPVFGGPSQAVPRRMAKLARGRQTSGV